MNRTIIILFAVLICFVSCDKEEIPARMLLPEKVAWSYSANTSGIADRVTAYNIFQYDQYRRYEFIYSVQDYSSGIYKSTIEFTYNENGEPVSVKTITYYNGTKAEGIKNYIRNGNTIDVEQDGEALGYIKLDEETGRAIRYTYYQNSSEGRYVYEHEYSYDNAGNLSNIIYRTITPTSEYREEKRFESDDRNGIYKEVNMPQWYLVTNNNLNLVNNHLYSYVHLADGQEVRLDIYDYEYNEYGYPVKIFEYCDPEWVGWNSVSYTVTYYQE